jgi:hypothetical protein
MKPPAARVWKPRAPSLPAKGGGVGSVLARPGADRAYFDPWLGTDLGEVR